MAGRYSSTWQERFFEKVAPPNERGCRLWTGGKTSRNEAKAYGLFYADGQMRPAHRWLLEQHLGRVLSPSIDACHSCDVRLCVELDHLFPGTRKQNMEDAVRKGRMDRTHKPKGEAHGRAVLTWEKVREIRKQRLAGALILDLAAEYGVSGASIHRIIHNRQWKE